MNEKAFRQLVLPLQRRMYAYALKLGLPPEDAADAVQETQLKLWRGREGIPDAPLLFQSYCLTTLRNECISHIRKRKLTDPLENAEKIPAEDYIERIEADDNRQSIDRIIDHLPDSQRNVIRLNTYGEMDVTEIASATGLSTANVRQLLSRGRKRMRQLLESISSKNK